MSLLLSVSKLSKTMGSKQLFNELSFGINEKQKIGLLGPNGAGKSTLLRILAGLEKPDSGEISIRKGVKLSFVQQEEKFEDSKNVFQVVEKELIEFGHDEYEASVQASVYLSIVGFEDFEKKCSELSGGWRKRLSICIAIAKEPELLILDEPTNHMDWDGILWLESYLKSFKGSFIIVSHDREFLDNLCNRTLEINKMYSDGYLSFDCSYKKFLEKKQQYYEEQIKLQSTLSNKARREVEWLRAGVKARTTKSQSRIKEAHKLLDNLSAVKDRNLSASSKVRLEIDSAGKKSKKLVELTDLTVAFDDNVLVENLNLTLGPKTCLGILGENGSGKTSLLKVIAGMAKNYTGDLFKADGLEVVYFDQKRHSLPQDINLMQYLGDGSDYTIFKGESVHVAAYASRFLFSSEKMQLKISQLSGGEQARLLIAKLLLSPIDVLILDEPTNDLDIDSIVVLESALMNFSGLALLVSHDRYFLSQLCDAYLALNGNSGWQTYADLNQWLKARTSQSDTASKNPPPPEQKNNKPLKKVKLSYKEKKQLETIEQDIETAEQELSAAQDELSEASSDFDKVKDLIKVVEEKQLKVNELYSVWDSIESKLNRATHNN